MFGISLQWWLLRACARPCIQPFLPSLQSRPLALYVHMALRQTYAPHPLVKPEAVRAREHILLGGVSVNERPDLHLVDPSGRRIEACPPLGAAGSLPRPEHCYATNHHKHDNDENDDDATAYAACVASAEADNITSVDWRHGRRWRGGWRLRGRARASR